MWLQRWQVDTYLDFLSPNKNLLRVMWCVVQYGQDVRPSLGSLEGQSVCVRKWSAED